MWGTYKEAYDVVIHRMMENCHIHRVTGSIVSRLNRERNLSKRVPVTVTLERELYDAIDDLVARRIFRDRSHAVNSGVARLLALLRENPAAFFGIPPLATASATTSARAGKRSTLPSLTLITILGVSKINSLNPLA